jgi:hypothetical protein
VASEGLHEDAGSVDGDTIERHRAWVSLREELEAIDWYDQRIDASSDQELRAILTHNRDEEKEHAALLLRWLAARDAVFAAQLADKVAQRGDDAAGGGPAPNDGSLGIGSLRGRVERGREAPSTRPRSAVAADDLQQRRSRRAPGTRSRRRRPRSLTVNLAAGSSSTFAGRSAGRRAPSASARSRPAPAPVEGVSAARRLCSWSSSARVRARAPPSSIASTAEATAPT